MLGSHPCRRWQQAPICATRYPHQCSRVISCRIRAEIGTTLAEKPVIILVNPQIGENIGAAARAMKNFGLSDLRLVAPRDGWPNHMATVTAVGAADLLDAAQLYDTVEEAIADVAYLYAATARPRFMNKDYVLTRDLAADYPSDAGRVGIMFGRESSGLTNAEVALASKVLTVDSDPSFPVLNLAQALVVICYELYGAQQRAAGGEQQQGQAAESAAQRPDRPDLQNEQQLCTKGDVEGLLQHMYSELDAAGFFEAEHKRQSVQINIRNIFTRVDKLSKPEVQMLRGIISKLTGARRAAGGSSQKGGGAAAGAGAAVDGAPDAAVVGER